MKILCILSSLITLTTANIPGKFCTSIIGNPLNVSLDKKSANISAIIFGQEMQCNNELYNLTDHHINFPYSKNDCLNKYLSTHGACPCPPHILYKNTSLAISDTMIGTIYLKAC
tara:strand:- start:948 stop:1289 length:342 start_codon:yes stop_codon:yes gene_type:complete